MTSNSGLIKDLRILNTRPIDQSLSLHQAISAAGGISIDLPALVIEPTPAIWLVDLPQLDRLQQAIFISSNAVNYFFAALEQAGEAWPSSIQTIAIGQASARALENWKIRVDHIPTHADSENLLQLEALQQVSDQSILLVKGEGGRLDIQNVLRIRGAHVWAINVYRRVLPETTPDEIYSLWHDEAVDIILFTSLQSIHNLFTMFGDDARPWLCNTPCLVISERLAEAAMELGMKKIIVSRYDALLETLKYYYQKRATDCFLFWQPKNNKDQ